MSEDKKNDLGIREDRPTDWFEPLYARSGNDGSGIPWANMKTHPSFSEWLAQNSLEGTGKFALVVGCGMGDDAIELEYKGFQVTAFDVSDTAIQYCKDRFSESNVNFVQADLLKKQSNWDRKFDFVLEIFTIQALPPIYEDELIQNISRFVAPGGNLLVIAEVSDEERSFTKGPPWLLDYHHVEKFKSCGFDVVERHIEKGSSNNDGNDIHVTTFSYQNTLIQTGGNMSTQANKIQTHRFKYATPENPADFNPADFVEKAISWVKSLVKPGEKIALSASGGVDSTIAAFLLDRIVGKDLHAFFIEDGCRRLINDEPEGEVTREIFSKLNFTVLEVRDEILPPLVGLSDGEEKRKTFIGNYRKVSDRHIDQVGASWIADGTIAPDIIETEGGFKSQHNVGWNYSVGKIEPLASLAKPQVRRVGEYLALPPSFTHRIPCPGPAQIIRTVGEFTEEKLHTGQLASDIIEQEIEKYYTEKHGKPYLYDEATGIRTPFQYFGMALDPNMEPDPVLADLARSTLGAEAECFKMDSQTTVVPEEGTRPEIPIYKPVSWIKVDGNIDYDKLNALCVEAWTKLELPRILLELCANDAPKTMYVVGMRAVESVAAKLARPVRIDEAALFEIGKKIAAHTGASRVAYDISIKPPATIEFE